MVIPLLGYRQDEEMQLLADALHPTAPILPAVVPPPMPGTGTRGVSRWELQGLASEKCSLMIVQALFKALFFVLNKLSY